MTHCQTSALMMARWFRLSGSYAGSFQAAQSGGDWGFTFDKVLHSWDLSGPLGYQGIHHMILLFIHSEWDESYQIAHHLLTQLSNENTVSAVWGAQTQMLHCNVGIATVHPTFRVLSCNASHSTWLSLGHSCKYFNGPHDKSPPAMRPLTDQADAATALREENFIENKSLSNERVEQAQTGGHH